MSESGLEPWIVRAAGAVTPRGGAGGGADFAGVWAWVALALVLVGVGILVVYVVRMRREVSALERGDPGSAGFASGEVLADVDELSRRLAEELDHKAARLERLIAEADARIERLEPAVRRAGSAANGRPVAAAGRDGGVDPVNAQVYEMADRGCSVVEIAQSLGQHVGKVELILALRR